MSKQTFFTLLASFALCPALTLGSPQLNSPIVARATFIPPPEEQQRGSNFLAKCSISLEPDTLSYNVTFYLNKLPLGHYVVQQNEVKSVTWETVQLIPGLNVYGRDESRYPLFSALFEPQTAVQVQGVYKCSVTVSVPGGRGIARYYSNEWDALDVSGKQFTPPKVKLTYTNEPVVQGLNVGDSFIGNCHLDVDGPLSQLANYKVKYIIDNWSRAQYVVKAPTAPDTQPIVHWQVLLAPPGLNIFRTNQTTYPDFAVQFVANDKLDANFNRRFQCDLELEIPGRTGVGAFYYSRRVCTRYVDEQCNNMVFT